MPPELPKPSEPPVPEEDEEGESDYKTALAYQNTDTRCSTQWVGSENDFCDLSRDWVLIKANSNEMLQEAHKPSLYFFQDVTRGPKRAEVLSEEEDKWIRSAYMGGLVWAEPYKRIATELDFNEYYPNILAHSRAFWPIGPDEFRTFSHISMNPISYNLEYEIYRANIEGQLVNYKCTKTFRYNLTGYYTYYDLQLAKNLGLHIELSSKSPNALIFGQDQLRSEHNTFYQWASYLSAIKNKGGLAGKVAKYMLVSLWGQLYTDRRRPGPHQCMAPFISAKGRKIISKKIRPLDERIKRIHTNGYIILGKATDQMLGIEYAGGRREQKIVKTDIVLIKNVINLKWVDFEEIIPPVSMKLEKSLIYYLPLPNEILDRIFHYHRKNEGEKLYPLLLVNKQ
ncbi:17207_t:CDS:2 [Dentiscutata heterogama]|uniref:17207_t:CDS:1 n=1 Tax=Dentiscutata heterogama TaxID=1316150 RepID=A0ACA9JX41_9GLOM|nr:17207_t:CDS:2 [Dentiscutata heterogama]